MSEWVQCPQCWGEVGIPDDAAGTIRCPKCDIVVYAVDPQTNVPWKPPNVGVPIANDDTQSLKPKAESRPKKDNASKVRSPWTGRRPATDRDARKFIIAALLLVAIVGFIIAFVFQ